MAVSGSQLTRIGASLSGTGIALTISAKGAASGGSTGTVIQYFRRRRRQIKPK